MSRSKWARYKKTEEPEKVNEIRERAFRLLRKERGVRLNDSQAVDNAYQQATNGLK